MRYEIELAVPGEPARKFPLRDGDRVRIGRSSQCELAIEAEGVQRFHLEIRAGDDGCLVTRAEGEVHVDGRALPEDAREVPLADGAEVRLAAAGGPMLRVFRLARHGDLADEVLIEARGLSIGGIVHEADLAVGRGEVLAILGRSGEGKTTLLTCLARLIEPSGGELRYAPGADRLAYVPQSDTLFPELTPRQTIHYAARIQGAPAGATDAILEEMELASFADRPCGRLSGGQRRRVSIAAALVGSPEVLCLDEPDSGLDPFHSGELMVRLRNLADRRRIGIVLTTHSLLHQHLMDRVVVLHRRRIHAQGPPAAVAAKFGVQNLHRIYQRLETDAAEGEVRIQSFGPLVPTRGPRRRPSLARLLALLERGLLRKVVERSNALATVLLPVAVALAIRLVFWAWPAGEPAEQAIAMPLLGYVAAIWLGVTASVQAVVSERSHHRHEKILGVLDVEYAAAKTISLAALLAGQVFVLGAILLARTPLDPGVFLAGLASGAAAGMVLGLAVSALSPTAEVALRLVPVLMIPQILFSRLTGFPIEDFTPGFSEDVLSKLAFTPHLEAIFGDPRALDAGWSAVPAGWTGEAGQLAGLVLFLAGLAFVGLWLQDRRERRVRFAAGPRA